MKGAEKLSFLLVTIGPGPETEVRRLQKEGYHTRSFFLDAAASCMVEKVARELHGRLATEFPNYRGTARFAPGFGDFPVSFQEEIMNILGGRSIGVSLRRDSFILRPVKSGTGVIGWISLRS
jgi:5-methyltetrahydrofolate--homocysteine methyltransferase